MSAATTAALLAGAHLRDLSSVLTVAGAREVVTSVRRQLSGANLVCGGEIVDGATATIVLSVPAAVEVDPGVIELEGVEVCRHGEEPDHGFVVRLGETKDNKPRRLPRWRR